MFMQLNSNQEEFRSVLLFILVFREQNFAELIGQHLCEADSECAGDVLVEVGILQ